MQKLHTLNAILRTPLIGIIRADHAATALSLADACIAGGVTNLEVSLTTPGGLEVIRELAQRHGDTAVIGAGTVLDDATARLAILAGARFLLAPNFDPAVVQTCNRYQVVSMPGVSSASEVVRAMEAGADIVKIFPGDAFGPAYLKALLAPLPQAPLMPSGGVTLDNMAAWFACGAVAVSVGGSLTAAGLSGDYGKVTEHARSFMAALREMQARFTPPAAH